MGRVPDYKRVSKEEFASEEQNLIGKLGFIINSFHEQVRNVLNGNIDFTNLNQEINTLNITVNSNGIPVIDTKFRSTLSTRINGITCIRAFNVTDTSKYPTSQPFISFTQNGNIVTINHVSGLQANEKYTLTLISIG